MDEGKIEPAADVRSFYWRTKIAEGGGAIVNDAVWRVMRDGEILLMAEDAALFRVSRTRPTRVTAVGEPSAAGEGK